MNSKLQQYTVISFLTGLLAWVLGACTADIENYEPAPEGGLGLIASVGEASATATRASQSIVKQYVDYEVYPDYFYILLEADRNVPNTEIYPDTTMGIFQVKSGVQGRLDDVNTNEPMNWKDIISEHTFYSWYLPWIGEEQYASAGRMNINPYREGVNLDSLYLKFFNSPEKSKDYNPSTQEDPGDNYLKWKNNAIYDKLIGARSGPWTYKTHGEYVELTHYHLVSQIRLDTLTLITRGQTVQNNVKGEITLYNIPTSATFYPYPEKYKDMPGVSDRYQSMQDEKNEGPLVVAHDHLQTDTLCFNIENTHNGDYMYIPPEVDFSNVSYKVTLKDMNADDRYSELGAFYGTFNDIEFKRKYQNLDDKYGNDQKVLHAGEMMSLRIILYTDGGGGLITVEIENWNSQKPSEAQHHSHPGIYTDSEASSFTGNANWENLYELYGEDEGDEKIFNVYENVTVNGNTLSVGEGYIIDGNGHLITMTSTNNQVKVGSIREVYISDGKNTVYIDAAGDVYIWNAADNGFTEKKGSLSDLGTGKTYTINLSTGVVS